MQVQATLSIYSPDLSGSIIERLERENEFTTVTDDIPKNISSVAFGLLRLDESYIHSDEEHDLKITHVCIIRKQQRVATGQVRIKATDIIALSPAISVSVLVQHVPETFRKNAVDSFSIGYKKVAPKTGIALFSALLKACPNSVAAIKGLIGKIAAKTLPKNSSRNEDAAAEKDALGIALDIFGIDRSEVLRNWGGAKTSSGTSFLNGLEQYHAYEDDIINHDLKTLPGWQAVTSVITGIVEFTNDERDFWGLNPPTLKKSHYLWKMLLKTAIRLCTLSMKGKVLIFRLHRQRIIVKPLPCK